MGEVLYPKNSVFYVSGTDIDATLTTDVKEFRQTGGDKDINAIYVFGQAAIVEEVPPSPYELELDIVWDHGSWEPMFLGAGTYKPGGFVTGLTGSGIFHDTTVTRNPTEIQVRLADGTGSIKKVYYFKNAYGTTYEHEGSAENSAGQGTVKFKVLPYDSSGNPNVYVAIASGTGYLVV